MKFSELWLREWVNPAIDSEALAKLPSGAESCRSNHRRRAAWRLQN